MTIMAISIHSLVKRETQGSKLSVSTALDFNPLPRKEGDGTESTIVIDSYEISIHSLVKRETCGDNLGCKGNVDFNPLPRKEGDA